MESTGGPETTGRYLVLLPEDDRDAGVQLVQEAIDQELRESDPGAADAGAQLESTTDTAVFHPELGVAVLPAPPARGLATLERAAADPSQPVLVVEPERWVHAIATQTETDAWVDDDIATWGVHATGADRTSLDGSGIGVAILDTGIDAGHPDFAQRTIVSASFVPGEAVDDGHGHGTHCAGIACGVVSPIQPPRYGVASNALLHVGKVLSNAGSGGDGDILAGIAWALHHGCAIVSMSLGAREQFGAPHSVVYEQIARRALRQGTAIFAAAGNDNQRARGIPAPVSRPANCPSIYAVAAIDRHGDVADFSNQSDPAGGRVDVAGPGVLVRSSWPRPTDYKAISGTSMATPFVAGIAALHAQRSGARGQALVDEVLRSATALPPLAADDVGSGLVQAP